MLRREADGVGWHVACAARKGRGVPAPMLGLFWTSMTRPACGDAVREFVVDEIEAELVRLGVPLQRLKVSGIVPEEGPGGSLDFTDAALDRLATLLVSGAPVQSTISWKSTAEGGRSVLVTLKLTSAFTGSDGWDGRFGADWEVFEDSGVSIDEAALGLTRVVARIAAKTRMVWAGISLDHWPKNMTQPPYEVYYRIPWAEAETGAERKARGYYWANLLTEGHLEELGGLAQVRLRCRALGLPAEQVDAGEAGPALLVRIDGDVRSMTDGQLAAVKELLDPILITRPYHWYAGWPLRVFKEPGTAFREIPVTVMAHAPVFEDDVPMGDD